MKIRKEDALNYHEFKKPGKIEVVPTKPLSSQLDLALAYSPGVAEPCTAIQHNPEDVYKYTAKGNLVAVISNGTAVLGLGNIGPAASKPVMEGKGVLFKKFAGIDVFDLEIDENDPERLIQTIRSLEPTFGGINLEDIKAPECFIIEKKLKELMKIPVMHDDQHGTAIISGAALLNALEMIQKKIENIKLVVSGAGAAAISCARFYIRLGVKFENVVMCDIDGVIRKDRDGLTDIHGMFATDRDIYTITEAMEGADVFLGLSAGNIISQDQIKSMAANPIVFALANPTPEISYEEAMAARKDIIMATGRSDYPNQVNNVIGFPYIFRGALDVRATGINEEMKLAAALAIANLAKEPVPDIVNKAYGESKLAFGKTYLIPKPLDPRLITTIAPAVAKAAMKSGVAKTHIEDWDAYELDLQERIGIDQRLMSRVVSRAKKDPKRVVFAEADNPKILKAAQIMRDEKIGIPILLGNKQKINKLIKANSLDLEDIIVIDPNEQKAKLKQYGQLLYDKRKRKGLTLYEAKKLMKDRNYFGAMMVELGEGDALISGLTKDYPRTILPSLQIIGVKKGVNKVAGMYIMNSDKGPLFFADTTVNEDPTADELVEIIGLTANGVRFFDIEPKIAILSYSNFGSAKGKVPLKTALATTKAKAQYPDLVIEGEMQANVALDEGIQKENYPFSALINNKANTLIFPDLASGNIAYKLVAEVGNAEAIGPILLGMNKSVHILQLGSSIREIVNMVAIAVVDAQTIESE
ncbi:NADP-dependent malic enzyme [Cyclobacterium amurskyense]|uniref:NADP-dependent malic enzyme n=1 Tax=Cyclobacterium amurskyense TaxID=320787 RepID=A0A0H4PAS0_9BACT|nr:NADP-dependent malic enzyme [Cyclobacterium amurskyense]AKP49858.1 NADP-dependent malic enzyme [Cyclobacterium amurskyense]|tara:strand:- start:72744 stop:75008 length:2265 start_codon:yes stop_codon:yes gene_type:complete